MKMNHAIELESTEYYSNRIWLLLRQRWEDQIRAMNPKLWEILEHELRPVESCHMSALEEIERQRENLNHHRLKFKELEDQSGELRKKLTDTRSTMKGFANNLNDYEKRAVDAEKGLALLSDAVYDLASKLAATDPEFDGNNLDLVSDKAREVLITNFPDLFAVATAPKGGV